jgi:hypothetical protein
MRTKTFERGTRKSEGRDPKSERRPNAETESGIFRWRGWGWRASVDSCVAVAGTATLRSGANPSWSCLVALGRPWSKRMNPPPLKLWRTGKEECRMKKWNRRIWRRSQTDATWVTDAVVPIHRDPYPGLKYETSFLLIFDVDMKREKTVPHLTPSLSPPAAGAERENVRQPFDSSKSQRTSTAGVIYLLRGVERSKNLRGFNPF